MCNNYDLIIHIPIRIMTSFSLQLFSSSSYSSFFYFFVAILHSVYSLSHTRKQFKKKTKSTASNAKKMLLLKMMATLPDVGMYVYPFLKICRFHEIYSVALAPRDSLENASNNWKNRCSILNKRIAAPIVDYFDCYSNGNWYCCHYDYYYDLQCCDLYHHCHHYLRHQQHSAI